MGQPRPSDWSSLGLGGDPVPGNVDQIRNSADRHFRKVADLIVDQAAKLRRIDSSSSDEWDSESGRAFREVANDLAGAIEKAEGRYREAATALSTYATLLDGVQDEADRILRDANSAEAALRRAQAIVIEAEAGTPEYDDEKEERQDAIDDAREALRAAQDQIEALIGPGGAWRTANRAAADAIRAAIDDEMSDQWYDGIKQAIHDARVWLNAIKDILAIIGAILVIVALFIPGVNLLVVAVIALVLAAITFVIVAAQWFAGDATTEELAWAALGLVLSIVGLGMAGSAASAATNTARIANSTAHSVGQTARLAGTNSYSAAFQAFKAGLNNPVVQHVDEVLEGIATLVRVVAVPGPLAPVASQLFGPAAARAAFAVGDLVYDIVDVTQTGHDVYDALLDWDGYIDDLDRVQVGSL
jgi:hypothetical protein